MALGIMLVLGGARSGKSEFAEASAADAATIAPGPGTVTYLATASEVPGDADWEARLRTHRLRRPVGWKTIETAGESDLGSIIDSVPETVLIDSLGTWIASAPRMEVDRSGLVTALVARAGRGLSTIVVSEEVGLGVHPASESGRLFRDVIGDVNRAVSAVADRVVLVVAGRVIDLSQFPIVDT
jgi:adenosyl cobinamide kinase/adenosyl cobinamide phosphate guanylyltransferase